MDLALFGFCRPRSGERGAVRPHPDSLGRGGARPAAGPRRGREPHRREAHGRAGGGDRLVGQGLAPPWRCRCEPGLAHGPRGLHPRRGRVRTASQHRPPRKRLGTQQPNLHPRRRCAHCPSTLHRTQCLLLPQCGSDEWDRGDEGRQSDCPWSEHGGRCHQFHQHPHSHGAFRPCGWPHRLLRHRPIARPCGRWIRPHRLDGRGPSGRQPGLQGPRWRWPHWIRQTGLARQAPLAVGRRCPVRPTRRAEARHGPRAQPRDLRRADSGGFRRESLPSVCRKPPR